MENKKDIKVVNVQAYKYDGLLYRQWNNVHILRDTKKHYVLLLDKTRVYELPNTTWTYKEPVIWFMPKEEMYNALVILKPKENYIYVNMASTPILEDNTIKFVDFDLDIKCYPEKELNIVDKQEFIENAKSMQYPKPLIKNIFKNLDDLIYKYNNFAYFFNNEVIDYYMLIAKKEQFIDFSFRKKQILNVNKIHPEFAISYDIHTCEVKQNKVNLHKKANKPTKVYGFNKPQKYNRK